MYVVESEQFSEVKAFIKQAAKQSVVYYSLANRCEALIAFICLLLVSLWK